MSLVNYKEDGIKFAQEQIEKGNFDRSSYLPYKRFLELYNLDPRNDNTNWMIFYNAWFDVISQKIREICQPEFDKFMIEYRNLMRNYPNIELYGDYDCNLYVAVTVIKNNIVDHFDL